MTRSRNRKCLNFFARVCRGPSFPTVDPLSDYGVAARVFEEGVLAHDMKFWGGGGGGVLVCWRKGREGGKRRA